MAKFKAKLPRIIHNAESLSYKERDYYLYNLGNEIRNAFRGKANLKDIDLSWHMSPIQFFVETLDAVEFLQKNLGRIIDIQFHHETTVEIRAKLRAAFQDGAALKRGLIYLAWRQRPLTYNYVGMASSPQRVTTLHGSLGHALSGRSTLSLLYPKQIAVKTLRNFEACLIRVLTTGARFPNNNVQWGSIPSSTESQELGRFAEHLRAIAERISKVVDQK
jgi:hypothetical protein